MADNVSGIGRGVTFGNGQQVFCAGDDPAECVQQGQEYISSYKAQTVPAGFSMEINLRPLLWIVAGYITVRFAVKAGVTDALERSGEEIARAVMRGMHPTSLAPSLARFFPAVAGDSNSNLLRSHAIAQAMDSLPIQVRNTIKYDDVLVRPGELIDRLSAEGYHLRDGKFVFDAKAARK